MSRSETALEERQSDCGAAITNRDSCTEEAGTFHRVGEQLGDPADVVLAIMLKAVDGALDLPVPTLHQKVESRGVTALEGLDQVLVRDPHAPVP